MLEFLPMYGSLKNPYRILIIEGSGSGKTNLLFNLITQQMVIDKFIHMKQKYQCLIEKRESTDIKLLNDSKAKLLLSTHVI